MALYEHVFITRPDVSPTQVEANVEEITTYLKEQGVKVGKVEYWGLRNLAYQINKQRKGHYSLINIDGDSAAILEVERRHRLSSDIMRYMTVKVDALNDEPSAILARKEQRRRDS